MGSSRSDEDDKGAVNAAAPNAAASGGTNGRGGGVSASNRHFHRATSSNHLGVPEMAAVGGASGGRSYSPVAETLFRKDLISAMKLPDNEPLTQDDYWVVTDTWKQEWERGVQVPVKPENLAEPRVSKLAHPPQSSNRFTL